jgi:hypothetical protein
MEYKLKLNELDLKDIYIEKFEKQCVSSSLINFSFSMVAGQPRLNLKKIERAK